MVLAIFNSITILSEKRELIELLYLVLPFLILGVISVFTGADNMIFSLFIIGGLYNTLIPAGVGDVSGSMFFVFAYYLKQSKITALIIIFITIISIGIRSFITEINTQQSLTIFIWYILIYLAHYYFLFKKNKTKKPKNIKKEDYDKLDLYIKGYTTDEICDILNLNIKPDSLRSYFTKLRKDYGCSNDIEFGVKLSETRERIKIDNN